MSRVDCDVWALPLGGLLDVATSLLTSSEQARLVRFRRPGDRLRHAGGRALLRLVAGSRLGVEPAAVVVARRCRTCGSDEHGKPYVDQLDSHVSVSHSGDLVLVAMTDAGPVGVDVEQVTGMLDVPSVGRYIVGPGEEPAADAASLYRSWCRKEAVVKATGHGLAADLQSVRVSAPDEPAEVRSCPIARGPVALADVELPPCHQSYVAAVAVLAPGRARPLLHDGRALIRTQTGRDP